MGVQEWGGKKAQKRGDICVLMADSCWYVAETNIISYYHNKIKRYLSRLKKEFGITENKLKFYFKEKSKVIGSTQKEKKLSSLHFLSHSHLGCCCCIWGKWELTWLHGTRREENSDPQVSCFLAWALDWSYPIFCYSLAHTRGVWVLRYFLLIWTSTTYWGFSILTPDWLFHQT